MCDARARASARARAPDVRRYFEISQNRMMKLGSSVLSTPFTLDFETAIILPCQ